MTGTERDWRGDRVSRCGYGAQLVASNVASAQHDVLTGLPNRMLLTDRLYWAMALASRHGMELALLFMDLDRFKPINDRLGHAVGDQVLQSVASRLVAGSAIGHREPNRWR